MILHLSTFHFEGGAGVAAARLHRALLKNGTDSHLLVPSLQADEPNATALATSKWGNRRKWAYFVAERVRFLPHEKDKSVRFAFSPAAYGYDLSRHPLVQQASILHLHWINFGFLSINSLEKLFALGKPVVWTFHDMWAMTGGCHYNRGCNHFLAQCGYCPYLRDSSEYDISFEQLQQKTRIYETAKLSLVSPSRWLGDMARTAPLTKPFPSITIPNCIDTDVFRPLDKTNIREQLKLPADKPLLLFTGANTQDPRKGFMYFKNAMEMVVKKHPGVEVIVFGKADPEAFTSFPAPVHYLGKITQTENLIEAYNAADYIVVPSLEDNLPNTIMEAMSCGTPAIGFATGGIPEMIDHAVNGFVCEPKSSENLAEAIGLAIGADRPALSAKARLKVLDNYSETAVAGAYQQLYRSLHA